MLNAIERSKDYFWSSATLGPALGDKWRILWKQTKNIRVRLRLDAHKPDQVYSIQTRYGPLHFRDNFGDITNLLNIFYRRTYRLQEVKGEGAILDIGANIGLAAAWFAFHNPGRDIYCFEPLAPNTRMVSLNCPAADIQQVALGSEPGKVRLRVDGDSVMASMIPCEWETQEVEFEVVRLDDFVESRNLGQIALMKIDVEGMEIEVLKGSATTLKKTRQVVMETHGLSRHQEAISMLEDAGLGLDSEEFDGATGMVFASRRD